MNRKQTVWIGIKLLAVIVFLLFLILACRPRPTYAWDRVERLYFQPMVGIMTMSEDDDRVSGGGYDMPLLGFGFQQPVNSVEKGGNLAYGFELTVIGSWENDVRVASISSGPSGGQVVVRFNNRWFLGDLGWGGYASYNLGNRVRIYAGAGPLFVYGRRHLEPEEDGSNTLENKVEEGGGLGGYFRTGLDFKLTDRYYLGACLRGMTSNLTFEDEIGKVRVEGLQGVMVLTITY